MSGMFSGTIDINRSLSYEDIIILDCFLYTSMCLSDTLTTTSATKSIINEREFGSVLAFERIWQPESGVGLNNYFKSWV